MSLSETELIYLMAYVDGQVDDDELPEVTALLERSEEARQIVRQHAALGDWVRETYDERAKAGGADQIATTVLAEIDKLGGGKVIEIEKTRSRAALKRQRIKEFSALFAVAAAAALFWLIPSTSQPVAQAPKAPAPPVSVAAAPPPASSTPASSTPSPADSALAMSAAAVGDLPVDDPEGAGVDVQTVESPDHPLSIFYVPAATGVNAHSSSVVVWIGE
jgi:hypothetical protein